MKGTIRPRNLRQQVAIERKRRDTVFFTIIILLFFYIVTTLMFGDMGLIKYSKLKENKNRLDNEIRTLERENKLLKTQVSALKEDNFYIEKYAREEYGLARPEEYIFQFDNNER